MQQRSSILAGLLCLALAGCTAAEPVLGARAFGVTWQDDVAAQLLARCGSCHGAAAAGGYRIDSYGAAIGPSARGGAVAVAGDPSSRLLAILAPLSASPPHDGQAALHAVLVGWVVGDRLAYARSEVHGGGIQDPASADFHGAVLARSGFRFPLCQTCHGADFGGGITGVTCLSCHVDQPTSCATCHGSAPTTGAHALHVLGGALLGKRYACGECHVTPSTWDSPGHLTTPAQVTFGPLAQSPSPTRAAPAVFEAGRCTNVTCHGVASPLWSSTDATTCTSCHGQPPPLHPVGACVTCHSAVIDAAGKLSALHIAGKTTLGDGSGTCQACHPTDRLGGAHQSHLTGTHQLAAPIDCTECHLVPSQVGSPGHFTVDGLPAVFPIGGAGPLASADGAAPSFDPTTTRCASTYCHGSGAALSADTSIEVVREPSWQPGSGAGRCGTCHGLPPLEGVHDPAWQITQCAQCHGRTVDAFGQILFEAGLSTHLDGVVDAP